MTDRDALLATILEAPDDDAPRLVYADWLTENGEGERGEFVRVQIELAGRSADMIRACEATCEPPDFDGCPARAMKCREWELLHVGIGAGWFVVAGLSENVALSLPGQLEWYAAGDSRGERPVVQGYARRGFIQSVTLAAPSWLQWGDALSWSPEQTEECKACGGWGNVADGWKDEEAGIISETVCIYCKAGRAPRPCPSTAQPLATVRLTTMPEFLRFDRGMGLFHFMGREQHRVPPGEHIPTRLLRSYWPAVRLWHLPPVEIAVNDELLEEARQAMRERGRV